ncbi:sensor histidine kinase [Gordonia sp. NPDC003376]
MVVSDSNLHLDGIAGILDHLHGAAILWDPEVSEPVWMNRGAAEVTAGWDSDWRRHFLSESPAGSDSPPTIRARSHGVDRSVRARCVDLDVDGERRMLVHFDMPTRRTVEDELTLTATYVEALSRHTAAGLLVLTAEGVVLHATARVLEQFDVARGDLVGHPITDHAVIGAGDAHGWSSVLDAMDPIATVQLDLMNPSARTPEFLGGTLERVPQRPDHELLLSVYDISDRVRREQQRSRDAEHQNYLARYNVMGDLAMAVAHELGQPLTAARNFLAVTRSAMSRSAMSPSALSAPTPDADRADTALYGLDGADRQIDRAASIITSMRRFVGHVDHVQEDIDLDVIVEECLYFIGLRAETSSVTVEFDRAHGPVPVRCERVLTGQVILNLCFNAVDEMAASPEPARTIRLRTRSEGGVGIFAVQDRGRGFTGDPFTDPFTSKDNGSGIGLALSYRIITRQDGEIWAKRLPVGSEFGFALPAVPGVAPRR